MIRKKESFFVVLEGVDRVGKDVQAARLVADAVAAGRRASKFTTPDYATRAGRLTSCFLRGTVSLSQKLGAADSVGDGTPRWPRQESERDELCVLECLQVAGRYAVADKVRRCLERGELVVCSRWWPSALVYGSDDGLDPEWIRAACSSLPAPDLYLLLAVDPRNVASRADPANRNEASLDKQARLYNSYLRLWREELDRELGRRLWGEDLDIRFGESAWAVIPGEGGVDDVASRVRQVVVSMRPSIFG